APTVDTRGSRAQGSRAGGRPSMSGTRISLLLLALLTIPPSVAPATQSCAKSCRQETRACRQTRCTGLHGSARRSCVETCKGIGGCAPLRTLADGGVDGGSRGGAAEEVLNVPPGSWGPVAVRDGGGAEAGPGGWGGGGWGVPARARALKSWAARGGGGWARAGRGGGERGRGRRPDVPRARR